MLITLINLKKIINKTINLNVTFFKRQIEITLNSNKFTYQSTSPLPIIFKYSFVNLK
jgi:hypothetical protein